MGFHGIRAHTQHNRATFLDLVNAVPEGAGFPGAPWRIVLRVKVQNNFFTFEIREFDLLALVIHHGEIGSFLSHFEVAGSRFRHKISLKKSNLLIVPSFQSFCRWGTMTAIVQRTNVRVLPEEFERLFHEHHGLVYRTAYRITGSAEDAEDVLQTLFVRLLRRSEALDLEGNPRGYLHRAAVNIALDIIRLRRRTVEPDERAFTDDRQGENRRIQIGRASC